MSCFCCNSGLSGKIIDSIASGLHVALSLFKWIASQKCSWSAEQNNSRYETIELTVRNFEKKWEVSRWSIQVVLLSTASPTRSAPSASTTKLPCYFHHPASTPWGGATHRNTSTLSHKGPPQPLHSFATQNRRLPSDLPLHQGACRVRVTEGEAVCKWACVEQRGPRAAMTSFPLHLFIPSPPPPSPPPPCPLMPSWASHPAVCCFVTAIVSGLESLFGRSQRLWRHMSPLCRVSLSIPSNRPEWRGGPGGVSVAAGGEQHEVEDVSEMFAGTRVLPEWSFLDAHRLPRPLSLSSWTSELCAATVGALFLVMVEVEGWEGFEGILKMLKDPKEQVSILDQSVLRLERVKYLCGMQRLV